MSRPIIVDTYSLVLNAANNYTFTDNLIPNIQNINYVRVLASNNNVILRFNFLRSSFILTADPYTPQEEAGLCVPSDKTWYETNTNVITSINASVYNPNEIQTVDSVSVALQFTDSVFNDTNS